MRVKMPNSFASSTSTHGAIPVCFVSSRRNVDTLAVYKDVSVCHQLSCKGSCRRKSHSVNHIVKSSLQKRDQIFSRVAFHSVGIFEEPSKLLLRDTVHILRLLLFTQLKSVLTDLRSALAVLTRRVRSLVDRAFSCSIFSTGPLYRAISSPYTRLRLGGLHPLCGSGVISFRNSTRIPSVAPTLFTAVSRPLPGP